MRHPHLARSAPVLASALLTVVLGCDRLMSSANVSGGPSSTAPGAGAVTRSTHERFFPIAAGVHGSTDCNSCHGGFGSFQEFTCLSCHDHAQGPTDQAHAGMPDYTYQSSACLRCHPTGQAGTLSRADHAKFFPIDAATPHANGQCADCHTNTKDRTQFTCTSCHDHAQPATDAGHAGIAGYKYDSTACLKCHPQGVAGMLARADHNKFFPIDDGTKHAAAQCTDCHSDPKDRTQFTCLSCHDHAQAVTDPRHANVMGYQYDSKACLRCHAQGTAAFDHATLGPTPNCIGCHQDKLAKAVTTPASNHAAHNFPTACEKCHHSFTSWGPGTAMPHDVVGGNTAKCETCHGADFTAATMPFDHAKNGAVASSCNGCHKDFNTWLKFTHPSNCFNGTTLRGHQGAKCAQCHANPADYKVSSCTACHGNRGTNCNGG